MDFYQLPLHPLAAGAFLTASGGNSDTDYSLIRSRSTAFSSFLAISHWQPNKPFYWQVVPFQKASLGLQRVAAQMAVLIRFLFWGAGDSTGENLPSHTTIPDVDETPDPSISDDAFCNSKVIGRQLITEGERVNLLTTHAPFTHRHLLVVPKTHRATFNELSRKEYQEVMTVALSVLQKYGKEAYLLHKTGRDSGQTVPHWHLQIIILGDAQEGLTAKVISFMKTLFPFLNFPLSPEKVSALANEIRKELSNKP